MGSTANDETWNCETLSHTLTGPRVTFIFSNTVAGVCVIFINAIAQSTTLLNFGCIDGSYSLKRSRIHKFEKNADTDPDSNLALERRRHLKM